jgi:hypothetical protein
VLYAIVRIVTIAHVLFKGNVNIANIDALRAPRDRKCSFRKAALEQSRPPNTMLSSSLHRPQPHWLAGGISFSAKLDIMADFPPPSVYNSHDIHDRGRWLARTRTTTPRSVADDARPGSSSKCGEGGCSFGQTRNSYIPHIPARHHL